MACDVCFQDMAYLNKETIATKMPMKTLTIKSILVYAQEINHDFEIQTQRQEAKRVHTNIPTN